MVDVGGVLAADRQAQPHVVLDRIDQVVVAAAGEEPQVEFVVDLVHAAEVALADMLRIGFVQVLEFLDPRCRRRQRNSQRGLALQQLAHLVDLAHFGRVERAHRNALVLLAHHDAGAREFVERLADVVAGRAEARNQVVFDQPGAGGQAAEDDVFAEHLGDIDGGWRCRS